MPTHKNMCFKRYISKMSHIQHSGTVSRGNRKGTESGKRRQIGTNG